MDTRDVRRERLAALTLCAARGVGRGAALELRARFGSYRAAVEAVLSGEVGDAGLVASIRDAARSGYAEEELRLARSIGARYSVPGGADYTDALEQITSAPVGLYVAGSPLRKLEPALAIVGTRAATRRGISVARDLACDAVASGLTIVSGLARGIDTAAHEGALEGGGRTVAVLGSGLGRVYPRENIGLARRIREHGALVSEYPVRRGPRAGAFPARNRIVAGLSAGVVVVEAGHRSGALITAARALEEGREVFAVPGPITEPLSSGPNGLIKAGAKLVESIRDVLEELLPSWGPLWEGAVYPDGGPGSTEPVGSEEDPMEPGRRQRGQDESPQSGAQAGPRDDRTRLVGLLTDEPRSIDELALLSGLATEAVASALFDLELAGRAAACPGGRYARPRRRVIRESQARFSIGARVGERGVSVEG